MDEEKISISIEVADRRYPLRIAPADEEHIRVAAKRINEKIMRYRQNYKGRDIQDALSITVLQFVMKLIKYEEAADTVPIINSVQQIDKQLEEYLKYIMD
ncbi:MAG: cell division protein ZapA [Prevotellaceae bacterium]|jgi:cell division protein ZapA|nr:cell division protein ZapA [Prevotellaceae bacterium]